MAQLMKTKIIASDLVDTIRGLGLVRTQERRVRTNGELHGPVYVWYEVRLANGTGPFIVAFKKEAEARDFILKLSLK